MPSCQPEGAKQSHRAGGRAPHHLFVRAPEKRWTHGRSFTSLRSPGPAVAAAAAAGIRRLRRSREALLRGAEGAGGEKLALQTALPWAPRARRCGPAGAGGREGAPRRGSALFPSPRRSPPVQGRVGETRQDSAARRVPLKLDGDAEAACKERQPLGKTRRPESCLPKAMKGQERDWRAGGRARRRRRAPRSSFCSP